MDFNGSLKLKINIFDRLRGLLHLDSRDFRQICAKVATQEFK